MFSYFSIHILCLFLFLILHFFLFFIQHLLDILGGVVLLLHGWNSTLFSFHVIINKFCIVCLLFHHLLLLFSAQSVVLILHPHSLIFSLSDFPLKNPHFLSFSLIIIISIFCVQCVVLHFLFHFTFHKIRIICILISSLSSSTFWAMCNLFNFQFGFLSARLLPISNVSQLATVVIYFSWKT